MKGMFIFYVNVTDEQKSMSEIVDYIKQTNKQVFEKINKELDYEIAFFPTFKEACRVEKIDIEKPFPRFPSNVHLVKKQPKPKENSNDQL